MKAMKTALEGIRVLDLGRHQAGPRAALTLARLGAEVIKVESPGGDESRAGGPYVRGQSAYWVQYNSGKKSISLDLRNEKGKEIVRELVKISDVFIQNFRPGVITEMGFSYEVLRTLNPRIVMLNVSSYGQYGPYRDRLGYDPVGQAIGGLMSITGFEGSPPTRCAGAVIDYITAIHGAVGVLAALREREISGEGQTIDVCLADTGFCLTEIHLSHYLATGVVPKQRGNRGHWPVNNLFKAKDGWVLVCAFNPNIWGRFCQCIGKPEWTKDPRFADMNTREKNKGILEEYLTVWLSTRTMDEAVNIMSEAGIPCAPANDIGQAAHSPHLWERELLVEVPDPVAGTIHVAGKYIKLSRSENVVGAVPGVGEHTKEILGQLLHYSPEQMRQLKDEGVI